jgi:hypothetical protein
MSRPYTPGGRFTSDWETNEIHDAITKDLTNPAGTSLDWYVWDAEATSVDPIYDVGANDGVGRMWKPAVKVPVIRAIINHGTVEHSHEGFYNADSVHFTIDKDELAKNVPNVFTNPDPLNRDRIVWQGQVYRPLLSQFRGIILERFTLVSLDCRQIMPEEMVNDSQFQDYAGEGSTPVNYKLYDSDTYNSNYYDRIS